MHSSLPSNLFKCLRIDSTRKIKDDKSLYNEYEEADSRLLFHITQSVKYCSFSRVSAVTSDREVFVSLIHHFYAWQLLGLKELSMDCGSGKSNMSIDPIFCCCVFSCRKRYLKYLNNQVVKSGRVSLINIGGSQKLALSYCVVSLS